MARALPIRLAVATALLLGGLASPAGAFEPLRPQRPDEALGSDLPPGGRVPGPPEVRASVRDRSGEIALRPGRDGRLVYVDPSGRFTAIVDHDGTVYFADRFRRPHRRNRGRGRGLGRPPEGARGINPFVGVRVRGPNEWLLRASGHDLHVRAKAQFLDRTASLRRELATAAVRAQLQQQLRALPRQLDAIWRAPSLSPAQRRRLLFQRWDECDEPAAAATSRSELDRVREAAATAARATIEAWVRRHAPRGDAMAFGDDELRRLNRDRRSRAPFDPYAREELP
ncbi:MAG: hypothetical protein K1X88_27635 [Nannocystaceae bacterium]|nr:hypothetical protein [Nannocystaceae bacterium]